MNSPSAFCHEMFEFGSLVMHRIIARLPCGTVCFSGSIVNMGGFLKIQAQYVNEINTRSRVYDNHNKKI